MRISGALLLVLVLLGLLWWLLSNDSPVVRAMFTTEVKQAEPVNRVLVMDDSLSTMHFFTELSGYQGQKIAHRWEYNGTVVVRKFLPVETDPASVSSSINIKPYQQGEWTVVVEDEDGWPIYAEMFLYGREAVARYGLVIMNP